MSGAGKSQAMSAYEDEGWFCIDNLPPRMISSLVELSGLEGSHLDRVAVACDVRGGRWFDELARELEVLREADGVDARIIFLEASDETLLTRFRETRRRHPLANGGGVLDGIARERELLAGVRELADVVIDSSTMNIWDLRKAVNKVSAVVPHSTLAVSFISFGFKHGLPRDIDVLLDVRFLENPYYTKGLAELTGQDQPVIDFLNEVDGWDVFLKLLYAMFDFLLPAYEGEGKRHLVVGFGCTGGRHRSVRIADLMGQRYGADRYEVSVDHRDIHRGNHPREDRGK